jgi:hypothetical protein
MAVLILSVSPFQKFLAFQSSSLDDTVLMAGRLRGPPGISLSMSILPGADGPSSVLGVTIDW